MKKIILFVGLTIALRANAQTDVGLNIPGIGYGASTNNPTFRFTYAGQSVGHYSLGWYDENTGTPFSYLSGFAGIRLFTASVPRLNILSNGNIGIGTTTPNAKFVVSNESLQGIEMGYSSNILSNYIESVDRSTNSGMDMTYYISNNKSHRFYNNGVEKVRITGDGNVGIGTANPISKLDVNGSINVSNGENITWGGNYNQGMPTIASSTTAGINFYPLGSTLGSMMKISPNGNVLIGKVEQTNTAYKLDINGKARANEIVVNTTGADFVFENNYKLRPLAEVESFVKQNKHLPEIPTAKTMQEEGVGVSELQTKLLQKVEELTLYLIEQNKRIENYQATQAKQQKEIEQLKALLNKK